jgi:hypothetical protein
MRGMSKKTERAQPLLQLQRQYERLRRPLGQIGYITQGSVQDRTRRQGGGAGYQWTRKLARKTVTVALTAEQFECMKEALSNYRMLRRRLKQMEQLSRTIIFRTAPHHHRRKRLSQTVLGTK